MREFGLFIDGQVMPGTRTSPVVNPATEITVALAARATPVELDLAVESAQRAFATWSQLMVAQRQKAVGRIAQIMEENVDQLGELLMLEQGKPLSAAKNEVLRAAEFFRYAALRQVEDRHIHAGGGRDSIIQRRPLGVVACIIPWNFPIALMALKVPLALIAGNTLVVKPAGSTPLSTLRFAELVGDILPAGVLNVLSDENDLGPLISAHPGIRKISFTGSTATGRRVMATAASTLKRVTLELGGNDPAIVLDDADPKLVAARIFAFAFVNSGQMCIAIKRVYVPEALHDRLCEELVLLAEQAVVGAGTEEGVQIGPLQNRAQFDRILELLQDCNSRGTILTGGNRVGNKGFFVRPAIVCDVADGDRIVDEEQFGPILPIVKYTNLDKVVDTLNRGEMGLGASIWTQDSERAEELADRLEFGTIWINDHMALSPALPFSGARQSGIGAELGDDGLHEFCQLRVVNRALPRT